MSGRAKGGHARAASMTPEQRREQASLAALARWSKPRPPRVSLTRKAKAVKVSDPHRYHPDTLPALVSYLKGQRDALAMKIEMNDASGPGRPPDYDRDLHAIETLNAVLTAIRDAELKNTKRTIEQDLGI